MVKKIAESYRQQESMREIEFRIDSLPKAAADEVLIRQVWENLLGNAVKYTGRVSKAVIEVGSKKKSGEYVFFVRDNGAGFAMSESRKLFGVFQRLHSQREFAGNGVGLAIVHKIIHRHGGRCWGEGEPGQGATFYFTLPR